MVHLSALRLCEEENLVCAFDELFLFGPCLRNLLNLLKNLLILDSQHNHFVLQNGELEDAVQPAAN